MTRNDRLVEIVEIRAVVVQCEGCKTEVHIPVGPQKEVERFCPVCRKEFNGSSLGDVDQLIDFLHRLKKTKDFHVVLSIPG